MMDIMWPECTAAIVINQKCEGNHRNERLHGDVRVVCGLEEDSIDSLYLAQTEHHRLKIYTDMIDIHPQIIRTIAQLLEEMIVILFDD